MGELIEGAMQQAAQWGRQFIAILSAQGWPAAVTYPQPIRKITGLPAPALATWKLAQSERLRGPP